MSDCFSEEARRASVDVRRASEPAYLLGSERRTIPADELELRPRLRPKCD